MTTETKSLFWRRRVWPSETELSPETRETRDSGSYPDPPALRAAREAREAAEQRVTEADAIRNDTRLSPAGQTERLKATHKATVERLAAPERGLARLEGEIEALKGKLMPRGFDPGDAVGALAGQEFRTYLRSLDGPARVAAVQRAIMAEDQAALSKIVGGPPELSGISPQTWQMASVTLARAQHPDKMARLEVLEGVADALRTTIRNARSVIDEES